ncbi:MAG: serine hydrolase, partial [Candidatus Sumerlaeota bacterium]|nr:serine hydrolase [Candidatus Sumerlaeota bacterium]
ASVTKNFTATLFVQMVERGILSLDDKLSARLPEFAQHAQDPGRANEITLWQILTHTAGLAKEPDSDAAKTGPVDQWESKAISAIPRVRFLWPPGERYHYSNIGYGLLGLAMAHAAGRPFTTLLKESILDPLGMKETFFIVPEAAKGRVAAGYTVKRGGTVDAERPAREHSGRGYKIPNGGLYSTAGDVARYVSAHLGCGAADLVSPAHRSLMQTVHARWDRNTGYGLGFRIDIARDHAGDNAGIRAYVVGHAGGLEGYTCGMFFEPEAKIGVILLSNCRPVMGHLMREEAIRLAKELAVADRPSR